MSNDQFLKTSSITVLLAAVALIAGAATTLFISTVTTRVESRGVHLRLGDVDGYRVGGGVMVDACGFTVSGGYTAPGLATWSDGAIADGCAQAVVRLSDKHIFFYW